MDKTTDMKMEQTTETVTQEVEVKDETVTTEADETTTQPVTDDTQIKALEAEINDLKQSLTESQTQLAEYAQTKDELAKQIALSGEYEALLTAVIEAKLESIPQEYKELIPSGSLKEQFDWLNKAEKANLFKPYETKPATVEIGKPLQVEVPKVDTTKLGAAQLMQMAYSTLRNK